MEKAFFIEEKVRLFGMLFTPDKNRHKTMGFVLVHPFAEEKKSAHRTGVDLARHLCKEGFPVLMFDLQGCGDSEGDFVSVRLADWIKNIEHAIGWLRQEVAVERIGLIGLRFGAYLSGYYAARHPEVALCIWIEPVLKPVHYLRKSLRHKLIKELCTGGKVISNRDDLFHDLKNNQGVDFDGYEIGAPFFCDLVEAQERQVLFSAFPIIPVALLVSVSRNGRVPKSFQEVAVLKPEMQLVSVCMELFWDKVDEVNSEELISCIVNYLRKKGYE